MLTRLIVRSGETVEVHSVAWNREQGWIACGCEGGLLKILKLEGMTPPAKPFVPLIIRQRANDENMFISQRRNGGGEGCRCRKRRQRHDEPDPGGPLGCHQRAHVEPALPQADLLRPAEPHHRLGPVQGWRVHTCAVLVSRVSQGNWAEEMVNNRNKSIVRDMQWNADGQKICIIYEDGAVIVGGVGGDRLWGKELKIPLQKVNLTQSCLLESTHGCATGGVVPRRQNYPVWRNFGRDPRVLGER